MTERIHLLVSREAKERYRRAAAREGKTLSDWLREAAEERVDVARTDRELRTQDDLRAFFAERDAAEPGVEPDWEAHRRIIQESISGRRPTP